LAELAKVPQQERRMHEDTSSTLLAPQKTPTQTKDLSMKTIWKFELTPNRLQEVPIPLGGQILTVKTKGDNAPVLWVLVDPDMPPQERLLGVYTTNTELPNEPGRYIASFTIYDGSLEFHVFEMEKLPEETKERSTE